MFRILNPQGQGEGPPSQLTYCSGSPPWMILLLRQLGHLWRYVLVTTAGGTTAVQWEEVRDAAKHPTMYMTAFLHKELYIPKFQ